MGLRDYIRQQLPFEWDKAATEMKMKTELISRICTIVPTSYKDKYHYKEARRYVNTLFQTKSCSIVHLVDATDMDLGKWQELNSKIREYEYQCK